MSPLVLLGAAALVGLGIYLARKPKPKSASGFKGTAIYHTPQEVGFALLALGYPLAVGLPGWRLGDEHTRSQFQKFQRDYNIVRSFMQREYGVIMGMGDVRTDGVVDQPTMQAVQFANEFVDINKEDVGNWLRVVQISKGEIQA